MASTPFTEIKRRVARNNGHRKPAARKEPGPQTAKKLRNISERFSSDDDDDDDNVMDISEQEFMREVARKRQEREALLAEEESQLQQHQHQSEKQSTSFASSRSTNNESQQQQLETQPQNGSEDTTRMANHGTGKEETGGAQSSSFNQTEELLTESFAETQPWEKELENLPSYNKQNNSQQNAPQKRKDQRSQQFAPQQDHHGREAEQNQQQPANNNNTNHGGKQSSTNNDTHRRQDHQQSDNQGMKQPYTTQQDGNTSMNNRHQSSSVPSHPQNAPQKDRRRQEYHPNYQRGKQPLASSTNNNSQLNHQSLPSFEQNSERNSQFGRQTSHTQPPNHRDIHHDTTLAAAATKSIPNPYHRRQPPPLMKNTAAANVPKISLEHLRSRQQGKTSTNSIHNRNTNGNRDNDKINSSNSTGSEGETWQEEAFRSSLLDVLGSFPSNYFNNDAQVDESMDENGGSSCLFATSATNNSSLNYNNNNLGGDSPLSTTSQTAASAQLHSKRVLDAASRSLARLAIASRHHTKTSDSRNGTTSRTSGGSSNDDESPPDFNPPSPRSLPSYMSVMNVYDDSIQNGTMGSGGYWGGGGGSTNNAMLSSSSSTNEVFSGQSVHSRNARTVQLSSVVPKGNRRNASSKEFSSWTTEELAFGTMLLSAQVCHEASCDPNFDGQNDSTEVSESCRVAGFVQNSKEGNMKPAVSPALVESCLGFLATAFACLESDFVYSVLKSTLKSSDGTALAGTVFDALSYFAPVSALDNPYEEGCTIPTLSLLALSRGLEAAVCVARFTTLDPSSACRAYSSPHHVSTDYATVDTGIDGSGVGWLSALGRDLGLKLEGGSRVGGPRHVHLSQIAAYAYDFILEYNPMLVDESTESFRGSMHGRDNRGGHRRGKSRGSLYVDTHDSQALDALPCRQPSIMKDRIFAAIAEYLSSMIHTGVVSGWLKNVSISEGENSSRTVDRLCGQLFRIIDTRSRLRRATNQSVASPDPGDSEAVCVASLSLLILLLPEHVNESVQSLNHSFRQMGNSSGSIDDLLHSTLMKKLVDMALSWQDTVPSKKSSKEKENIMNKAISNTVYILSDIILVGGSELIASQFGKKVENFLQSITESICAKGRQRSNSNCFDSSGIEAPLLFLLQLHTGSPLLVRHLVRNFIEQSSANGEDIGYFVAGLLHLSANKSFSVSSCASSLLRALIDGNPLDRTQDRLSEMIINEFDTEDVGSTIEGVLRSLIDSTYTSQANCCNISEFRTRSHARICVLSDILNICIQSINASEIFALTLSNEVLNFFADAVQCDQFSNIDTLGGSAILSLISLFASFVNNGRAISNDETRESILSKQRNVQEQLICGSSFLSVIEVAMAQGQSADMTLRALNLQKSLLSVIDERSLAITFTKASDSVARKETTLRERLTQSEKELHDMVQKYKKIEIERDSYSNSFHDQRLSYERQLEWARSEARTAARNNAQLHIEERRYAEGLYHDERELRMRAEEENEKLASESSSDKARIHELEELLKQERKARQGFEASLDSCKNELSTTLEKLERSNNDCHELQEKLDVAEEQVTDLTESSEDAQNSLEETCSKLVNLATIVQRKEVEWDKYKAELRSAVNTASKQCDTAIQKYDAAKQKNKLLTKQMEELTSELREVKGELKDVKARRADQARLRKNQPTNYINQLHKDPKKGRRKGKENSFDG